MEKLSHLIHSLVDAGQWKGVHASQSGPKVSHLFFADDLLLFAEASSEQATLLKRSLDLFCSLSGQAVSYEKSLIFCSPNTSKAIASDISSICGSPLTNDLGNYLGMPLVHERVNQFTYANIFDKVQSRLSSWKSKTLSMASRLVLIQSVSSAIPNYAMQTAKLPLSLCDKLDKLNRDFLWGDTEDKKKVHLVNWETVCQPKQLGGIGIKNSSDMNQAMLAKASWRIWHEDSGLWTNIYKAKYLQNQSLVDENYQPPSDCSHTWRSIIHGAVLLRKGFQVNLGIGAIVDAEAWGIYYGLKIARNLNIMQLEVESDSAIIMNLLQHADLSCHPLGSLIAGCHFLSSNMENIKFSHIFRECNMTADSLAKMSINHAPSLVILKEPPIHAASAYLDDLNDVPRPRAKRTGD
ncbi:hypothetical protein ACLB2K_022535 [Fragaria x ananassa]